MSRFCFDLWNPKDAVSGRQASALGEKCNNSKEDGEKYSFCTLAVISTSFYNICGKCNKLKEFLRLRQTVQKKRVGMDGTVPEIDRQTDCQAQSHCWNM